MVIKKHLNKKSQIYDNMPAATDEERYLAKLNEDLSKINDDYISYAEKNQVTDSKQLSVMQRARYAMMLRACVSPISNGCSRGGIIQSIGMFAGMCLMDKNFSEKIKSTVSSYLLPYVEAKVSESGENSYWSKFAYKLKKMNPNSEMPLEPDTVALTKFAYMKRAYSDMRQPGADVNSVMSTYEKAVSKLYSNAEKNGIKPQDINSSMLNMVGRMAENDPSVFKYFDQTSSGGLMMDGYEWKEHSTIGEDGKPYNIMKYEWSGKFKNAIGEEFNGELTLRKPATATKFEQNYSQFIGDTVKEAISKNGNQGFDDIHESIVSDIHKVQWKHYSAINEGIKKQLYSAKEVDDKRRDVSQLKGVKFDINDLSRKSIDKIKSAVSASFKAYLQSNSWNLRYDDVYDAMMADDGLNSVEINDILRTVEYNGKRTALNDFSDYMVKYAKKSVQAESTGTKPKKDAFTRNYKKDSQNEDKEQPNLAPGSSEYKERQRDLHTHAKQLPNSHLKTFEEVFGNDKYNNGNDTEYY